MDREREDGEAENVGHVDKQREWTDEEMIRTHTHTHTHTHTCGNVHMHAHMCMNMYERNTHIHITLTNTYIRMDDKQM